MGASPGKEVAIDEPKPTDSEPRVVGENGVPVRTGCCGCHYVLITLLFLVHVVLAFGLAISWWTDTGSELTGYAAEYYASEVEVFYLVEQCVLYSSIAAVIFVLLFYGLMRCAATLFIFTSQILLICSLFAAGGVSFYDALATNSSTALGEAVGDETLLMIIGSACLVGGALIFLWLCFNWRTLQSTSLMIAHVSRILTASPGSLAIQFLLTLVALGWILVVISGVLEACVMMYEAEESYGSYAYDSTVRERRLSEALSTEEYFYYILIVLYGVLILFWGTLVITNISVVTTCAVVGTWYHSPTYLDRGLPFLRPAVWGAFKRACTNFLGSIALGSLLLAIVRTVIVALKYFASKIGEENQAAKLACCCITCCLGCFERIMEWLSEYAYAYMAVYGQPFMTSGARVVSMMTNSGMQALAQTFLTSTVVRFGDLLGGVLGALVGYVVYVATGSAESTYIAVLTGGIVGLVITDIGLALLSAGVKTIFVCCAEDPGVLYLRDPELARLLKLSDAPPPEGLARP